MHAACFIRVRVPLRRSAMTRLWQSCCRLCTSLIVDVTTRFHGHCNVDLHDAFDTCSQVGIETLSGLLFVATMGQIMGDVMADTLVR